MRTLKIKRAFLFLLGFIFFLFPGQGWYLTVQSVYQPPKTQAIEIPNFPLTDYPVNVTKTEVPFLTAQAAVVMDRDSAVLMSGKNEQVKLLPASTVKIMTALVALDFYDLNNILTVEEVNGQGQDMKLVKREEISVENLMYGVLVASANDAASVLAQKYPGGEQGFMAAMNNKAKELNLNDTYFANPTGLDSDEWGNLLPARSYTTALDLARLASWAMRNEVLAKMVATPRITVSDTSGRRQHQLYSINELLGYLPGIKGIKTGWTEEAGECLASYTEREGRGIITVVLGSGNRFGETARLVEWAFSNHQWEKITPSI